MLHSHRVLWRGLRVAGLPMPGAEHDACGAALVGEVVIQGPDYADRVLRDKRYKVWLDKAPQITALYDLSEDPLERHNQLTSPASAPRAALARGLVQ